MQFGEGAGQRESDADALGIVAVLHERFEYPAAVLSGDDRAVVADRDHGIVADSFGLDLDVRLGVFQGVVQQVVEYLVQSRFVGEDEELFILVAECQPEVAVLGRLREVEAEEADLLDQVEIAAVEHVAVALDLHEIEQFLHQLREVFGVVVDDHQVFADLSAALPGGEDVLQRRADERERGFDFMDDVREERHFLVEQLDLAGPLVFVLPPPLAFHGPAVEVVRHEDARNDQQQDVEQDRRRRFVETLGHRDLHGGMSVVPDAVAVDALDLQAVTACGDVRIEDPVAFRDLPPAGVVTFEPAEDGVARRRGEPEQCESEPEGVLTRVEGDVLRPVDVARQGRPLLARLHDPFADAQVRDDDLRDARVGVERAGIEADESVGRSEIERAVRSLESGVVVEFVVEQSVGGGVGLGLQRGGREADQSFVGGDPEIAAVVLDDPVVDVARKIPPPEQGLVVNDEIVVLFVVETESRAEGRRPDTSDAVPEYREHLVARPRRCSCARSSPPQGRSG